MEKEFDIVAEKYPKELNRSSHSSQEFRIRPAFERQEEHVSEPEIIPRRMMVAGMPPPNGPTFLDNIRRDRRENRGVEDYVPPQ